MNEQSTKAGLYASAAMHAALLAFLVFGFAFAPKFEDAAELIPVDTVTDNQFNQIMKGERDAKPIKEPPPAPPQRVAAVEPPPSHPADPTDPAAGAEDRRRAAAAGRRAPRQARTAAARAAAQANRRRGAGAFAAAAAQGDAAAQAEGRSAGQDSREGQRGSGETGQAEFRPQRDRQADPGQGQR